MFPIRAFHPVIPTRIDTQQSPTAPFQLGSSAVPRAQARKRAGATFQAAIPSKRTTIAPGTTCLAKPRGSAAAAQEARSPAKSGRASLAAANHTSPRRAVTVDTIRGASQLLAYDEYQNVRACAGKFQVSERELRSFVKPDGNFTDLGHRVHLGSLLTPGDRQAAQLPPLVRKTELTAEDFNLANGLLGRSVGKMSRTLFCDLFGYDYATIYRAYNKDGSLTPWGRENREAQPDAAPSPDGAAGAVAADEAERAAEQAAARCLSQRALHDGIAIGYWEGGGFRRLGVPGARFAGDVDRMGGHWRIRPARDGHYRLAPGPRETDHIVNILHLHEKGGRQAVAARYDLLPADQGSAIPLVPKPGALPDENMLPPDVTAGS
ncbi:hypothetical protein [Bordetella genomosp. 11]|uniref:Uncharacterized protein n=1 Tax=Bordetella genomosp. 11 TaxID=1416808 RepID=A0A261UCG5_9BORD|nr:hypothetical protein [Bordetella genomosp. 11]OZI59624.1 hypothetical protein CAL28_08880 [Bordetella genomosp. 11]